MLALLETSTSIQIWIKDFSTWHAYSEYINLAWKGVEWQMVVKIFIPMKNLREKKSLCLMSKHNYIGINNKDINFVFSYPLVK